MMRAQGPPLDLSLAGALALLPARAVISPINPPADMTYFAQNHSKSSGPTRTSELISAQATTTIKVQPPNLAHHSRSSSSVKRLGSPAKIVMAHSRSDQ